MIEKPAYNKLSSFSCSSSDMEHDKFIHACLKQLVRKVDPSVHCLVISEPHIPTPSMLMSTVKVNVDVMLIVKAGVMITSSPESNVNWAGRVLAGPGWSLVWVRFQPDSVKLGLLGWAGHHPWRLEVNDDGADNNPKLTHNFKQPNNNNLLTNSVPKRLGWVHLDMGNSFATTARRMDHHGGWNVEDSKGVCQGFGRTSNTDNSLLVRVAVAVDSRHDSGSTDCGIEQHRRAVTEIADGQSWYMQKFHASQSTIGTKRMGELNREPFIDECKKKLGRNNWCLKSMELCSLWHPFKIDPENNRAHENLLRIKSQFPQFIIDEDDESMKELKDEWGDMIYKAVIDALLEMDDSYIYIASAKGRPHGMTKPYRLSQMGLDSYNEHKQF
ncbi:hypothetical protein GQ457_14G026270 [Hibiscus cannabinus]